MRIETAVDSKFTAERLIRLARRAPSYEVTQMRSNSTVLPTALSCMIAARRIHNYRTDTAHDDASNFGSRSLEWLQVGGGA